MAPPRTTPDRERIHRWIARASFPEERLRCEAFSFGAHQDDVILKSRRYSWDALFTEIPEKKREILARRGMTERQWKRALCDVEVSRPRRLPEWAKTFIELYERWPSDDSFTINNPPKRPELFLTCIWAELSQPWLKAQQARWKRAGVRLSESSIDDLLKNLKERLAVPLSGMLHSYHNDFRTDRDDWRVRLQTRSYWEKTFDHQPILVNIIGHLTFCWRTATLEMLDRFIADLPKFSAMLWEKPLPAGGDIMVSRLRCGLGDPHRGGRSVAIFETGRGDVVYKPKDLAGTRATGLLLRELHPNHSDFVPLTPEFLLCSGYGWEQRVAPRKCSQIAQVETFYRRLGGWLFLLQILNGNDFWYDNLIADADMPWFIDYETIIGGGFDDYWQTTEKSEHIQQLHILNFIGILPMIIPGSVGDDVVDGIDISVSAPPGKQRVPFRKEDVTDQTSNMDAFFSFEASDYAPFYRDEFQDMNNFLDVFIDGYRSMKKLLESPPGYAALQRFFERIENTRFRHIVVHTWQCYAWIAIFFRKIGHDGARAAVTLDSYFPALPDFPLHVVEGIKNDIWNNDVPLFELQPGKLRVFNTSGDSGKEDFFKTTALDKIKKNYKYLLAEHERQVQHIKTLFSTRPDNPRRPWRQSDHGSGTEEIVTNEELLLLAKETGNELASVINQVEDLQDWFVIGRMGIINDRFVQPLPKNFEGCSGILVFLSRLQAEFPSHDYAGVIRKCYRYLIAAETIYPSDIPGTAGVLTQVGSKIIALCHLSRVRSLIDIDVRPCIEKLLENLLESMRHSNCIYADYRHGICGLLCLLREMEFVVGESIINRWLPQLLALVESGTLRTSPEQTDTYQKYAERFLPEAGRGLLLANRYMQDRRPALTTHPGYLKLLQQIKTPPAWQPSGDAPPDGETLSGEIALDQGYRLLSGSHPSPQPAINDPVHELVRRKRYHHRWFPENWAEDRFLPGAVYGQADVGLLLLSVRARKNLNPFRAPDYGELQ